MYLDFHIPFLAMQTRPHPKTLDIFPAIQGTQPRRNPFSSIIVSSRVRTVPLSRKYLGFNINSISSFQLPFSTRSFHLNPSDLPVTAVPAGLQLLIFSNPIFTSLQLPFRPGSPSPWPTMGYTSRKGIQVPLRNFRRYLLPLPWMIPLMSN